jgi:competence protein ComEC
MIAFILGVACFWIVPATWLSVLMTVAPVKFQSYSILIFIIVAICAALAHSKNKNHLLTFSCVISCIIGFVLAMYQHDLLRTTQANLPAHTETVEITGTIQSKPILYPKFISFKIQLDSIEKNPLLHIWQPSVQLNWYTHNRKFKQNPKLGDRWLFNVRLKTLHGMRNPNSFDYERWGWSKRIIAKGYIDNRKQQKILLSKEDLIYQWRNKITVNIQTAMSENPGLAASLLVGDKSSLTATTKLQLQKSGLAHLLAISGLHIGMVAFIGFWFFKRLWKLSSRLCLLIPAVDMGMIFSVAVAFIYAVLSGFGIPAQRALLMLVIFSLIHLFRLQWKLLDILLLSLTILLLIDPITILDSGGWLSFGAVFIIAGLLRFQKQAVKPNNPNIFLRVKNWVLFSGLLWLSLLPLSIIIFSKLALLGWLANIIAIPLMSFVIMPMLLTSAFVSLVCSDLAKIIMTFADSFLTIISYLSEYIAVAGKDIPHPKTHGFLLGFMLFIGFLPRSLIPKISVFMLAILFASFILLGLERPREGARLIVFDVGQGLAAIWEDYSATKDREPIRILVDTGYGNAHYQSAKSTWLPYFKSRNIDSLTALIISHSDADHSGGFITVQDSLSVETVYSGQALGSQYKTTYCHQTEPLKFAHTTITFLDVYDANELSIQKDNNQSCVLLIDYRGSNILLPGDIEIAAEKRLLNKQLLKPVDVVIAPHHGSNTSSSWGFIKAIKPRFSLFSVGYLNRYKFPRNRVVNRYQLHGASLLNTAEVGAIECRWKQSGYFEGCFGLRESDWGRWRWQFSQ